MLQKSAENKKKEIIHIFGEETAKDFSLVLFFRIKYSIKKHQLSYT